MIGCVTQTADGKPLVPVLEKTAAGGGPQLTPHHADGTQLTPAHEAARAYMRAFREHDDEDADGDDADGDDDQDVATRDMGKTRGVLPSPADSPDKNVPVTSGPIPTSLRGKHSVETVGGVRVERVDFQQLGPRRLANLRTAGPDASGSSLHCDPGQVRVQAQDQAAASASTPLPGSPSASPKRPDFGPAPSGHGQRFGNTPSRTAESGF